MRAAKSLMAQQGQDRVAATIVLTDKQVMQRMNSEFAGEDHATDVLSFPDGEIDPDSGLTYLGDVVICVPLALEQAADREADPGAELALLAIHGSLHLLGFDHAGAEEQRSMWAVQDNALRALGYASEEGASVDG